MSLSEHEENILAELEKELKATAGSYDSDFEKLDELKKNSSDKDSNISSLSSFDAKKATAGFFLLILGLILILVAVYSYSAFGVLATVILAVLSFSSMIFGISRLLQSFGFKF